MSSSSPQPLRQISRSAPRKRPLLRSLVLILAFLILFTARKIFEYSAAPDREKESNFIFPPSPDQDKPTVLKIETLPALEFAQKGGFTDDASHMNHTAIYGVVRVANEEDIRTALTFARANHLKVTSAGQQHSMGGQSFSQDGLVLDLRGLNHIRLDKAARTVNVQSGVRWWQLQQLLDPEGFSVKSMQSINIFSVGGTLSVNAHGMDPSPGPIAPTVRSLRVMLSSGEIVRASPSENADLFRHVLGGYGLFGVILDADLDIGPNEVYNHTTHYLDYRDFPGYYQSNVANDSTGLFIGRLSVAPGTFLRETAVHQFVRTDFNGRVPPMNEPPGAALPRFVMNFSKTGGFGRWLRWTLGKKLEPHLRDCITRNQAMSQKDDCLVSRNSEMYDNMAYLKNRLPDTDILQEYFVPMERMPDFVDGLRDVVRKNGANLLNVTIRTVHQDRITALPYASQDMFAFVLYFNVKFNNGDNEILRKTTVDLIDVAGKFGGTYYLPYQLYYSPEQLKRAYPEIDQFFAAKKRYDPAGLFTNKFFEKYGA